MPIEAIHISELDILEIIIKVIIEITLVVLLEKVMTLISRRIRSIHSKMIKLMTKLRGKGRKRQEE